MGTCLVPSGSFVVFFVRKAHQKAAKRARVANQRAARVIYLIYVQAIARTTFSKTFPDLFTLVKVASSRCVLDSVFLVNLPFTGQPTYCA